MKIVRLAKLKEFDLGFDKVTQKLTLTFGKNEGFSFQDNESPSVLGFKKTPDPSLKEFATIKKSAKQALKSTVAKTARKQIGGAL